MTIPSGKEAIAYISLVQTSAIVLCFLVALIYLVIKSARARRILACMERLGYKRVPFGAWNLKGRIERLKDADKLDTLGSPEMDAVRCKLRRQADSPMFGLLLAVIFLIFASIVKLASHVSGTPKDATPVLLMAGLLCFAIYGAIKLIDKSWRCKTELPSPQSCK